MWSVAFVWDIINIFVISIGLCITLAAFEQDGFSSGEELGSFLFIINYFHNNKICTYLNDTCIILSKYYFFLSRFQDEYFYFYFSLVWKCYLYIILHHLFSIHHQQDFLECVYSMYSQVRILRTRN